MKLLDFRRLTKEEKVKILIDTKISIYLGWRMAANRPIYLYWYDGIFAEMCISQKNKMDVMINAFTGVAPLYFYTDLIDISDLKN